MEKINEEIRAVLKSSPIDLIEDYSFISTTEKEILLNNQQDIDYLYITKDTPLKIVLMGEVKAGKSTLLNAIVGEEISPVGSTETTTEIIKVKYGKVKAARILYSDGTDTSMEITDFFKYPTNTSKLHDSQQAIDSVEITYPLSSLHKLQIVDTPGVESITKENQQTTIDFIQQSDVILWILSVHHLGQVDISEQISNVIEYGKPVYILLNRIDQIEEEERKEAHQYVIDSYSHYVEDIFLVSAYNAFNGVQTNDEELLSSSGLPKIIAHLEEKIEINATEVKDDSIHSSYKQIYKREVNLISAIIESINYQLEILSESRSDVDYQINKIVQLIDRRIDSWMHNELMSEEETEVRLLIEDKSLRKAQKVLNHYTSVEYVNQVFEKFTADLHKEVNQEISTAIELINQKISDKEKDYIKKYYNKLIFTSEEIQLLIDTDDDDLLEGAKSGAFVGGVSGLSLAAFQAILGPNAAYITLGAAVSSILPGLLITGAVAGTALNIFNRQKNIEKLHNLLDLRFKEVRENIVISSQAVSKYLSEEVAVVLRRIQTKFTEYVLNGNKEESLITMQNALIHYKIKLENIFNTNSSNLASVKVEEDNIEQLFSPTANPIVVEKKVNDLYDSVGVVKSNKIEEIAETGTGVEDGTQIQTNETEKIEYRKEFKVKGVSYRGDQVDNALDHIAYGLEGFKRFDGLTDEEIKNQGVRVSEFSGAILDDFQLIPEPSNPYDSNAIKVMIANSYHIGYVPREMTQKMLPFLLYKTDYSYGGNIEVIGGPYKEYNQYSMTVATNYQYTIGFKVTVYFKGNEE